VKNVQCAAYPRIKPETAAEDPFNHSDIPFVKLTTKTVRNEHLPDVIHRDHHWMARLLPTAYYRLYVSKAPFDEFLLSSSELPNIVQYLIKLVYGSDASQYNVNVNGKSDPILLNVSLVLSLTRKCYTGNHTAISRSTTDATIYTTR
jgi:hypothetical protein